jgi:hypothetical protein
MAFEAESDLDLVRVHQWAVNIWSVANTAINTIDKARLKARRKSLVYIEPVALMLIAGCNDVKRTFDSEISAINRQTEVLKYQNRILERIALALENDEGGESK